MIAPMSNANMTSKNTNAMSSDFVSDMSVLLFDMIGAGRHVHITPHLPEINTAFGTWYQ